MCASATAVPTAAAVAIPASGELAASCPGTRCCGCGLGSSSGSRISALNPLPNAFLGTCDYLLGELDVAFCTLTMYVVEYHWHSVAWCFRQSHISWYNAIKYLCSKEAAQVCRNLLRKCCPVVIHCQKNALNSEGRIDGPSQAHQGVQKLGYSL